MKEFERLGGYGFLVLILFFFLLIFMLIVEPGYMSLTRHSFPLLNGTGDGIRIAFISDVHAGLQKPGWIEGAVARINDEKPDIVLLGGDYIESNPSELDRLSPLANLSAPYGAYAVLGNHDYGHWECGGSDEVASEVEAELESLGVIVLRNENRALDVRGNRFALVGVDEFWECRNNYTLASDGAGALPKLVLVHNLRAIPPEEVDGRALVLAGHTHCGLFRVPLITELALGSSNIAGAGTLKDGVDDYITCGLSGAGARFLTNPEISVITIK